MALMETIQELRDRHERLFNKLRDRLPDSLRDELKDFGTVSANLGRANEILRGLDTFRSDSGVWVGGEDKAQRGEEAAASSTQIRR